MWFVVAVFLHLKCLEMELRQLVEEYMISIEIGRHDRVAELSSKICILLIELLDNHIVDYDDEINNTKNGSLSNLKDYIENICRRIQARSELANAYNSVLRFVQIRDLVCLSKLIGAIPDSDKVNNPTDFDFLTQLLRQSILLLKSIHRRDSVSDKLEQEIWINRDCIRLETSIGFSTIRVDLDTEFWQKTGAQQINYEHQLIDSNESRSFLGAVLESEWFKQFSDEISNNPYPVDRFTILIAIWIIGLECRHKLLEQLVNELINKIVHEEAASCNEEELIQLSQAGSFWLSHHKKHLALFLLADTNQIEEEEDDGIDDDHLTDASDSSHTSSSKSLFLDEQREYNINQSLEGKTLDMKSKLKKIIDGELLHEPPCPLCGHRTSELLGPISKESCPDCGNKLKMFCSISYRPLKMFNLVSVISLKPRIGQIVIVSASEWSRHMIARNLPKANIEANDDLKERVDISETFERLTVIRRDHELEIDDSLEEHSTSLVGNDTQNESDDDYNTVLKNFAHARGKRWKTNEDNISESFRILEFIPDKYSILPIYSPDLLLLDSLERSVNVRLVALKNIYQTGRLWSCRARSPISKLMFGCGRIFASLDLVRLGQGGMSYFRCPYCEIDLTEIRSLSDQLMSK